MNDTTGFEIGMTPAHTLNKTQLLTALKSVLRTKADYFADDPPVWMSSHTVWIHDVYLEKLLHDYFMEEFSTGVAHFMEPLLKYGLVATPRTCALHTPQSMLLILEIDPDLIWDAREERPILWVFHLPQNRHLSLLENELGIPARYLQGPKIGVLLPEQPRRKAFAPGRHCSDQLILAIYPNAADVREATEALKASYRRKHTQNTSKAQKQEQPYSQAQPISKNNRRADLTWRLHSQIHSLTLMRALAAQEQSPEQLWLDSYIASPVEWQAPLPQLKTMIQALLVDVELMLEVLDITPEKIRQGLEAAGSRASQSARP